jgi:hypothetical protein
VEPRLLIVTPARDEGRHLRAVVEAMIAQERRPDLWVVVDDGSTDDSMAILDGVRHVAPFMRVARTPPRGDGAEDRLASGAAPRAFNVGLAAFGGESFDFIGKIDADVSLPREYFRVLLERFGREPSLGIAGGTILERRRHGDWRPVSVPSHHVPGALKLYRRECFERIGGVQSTLAWDTIDEMYARMYGFTTRSYGDLEVLHHKRTGAAAGVIRGKARHGACAWIAHYPLYFVVLRAMKLGMTRPAVISGLAFLCGYAKAACTGVPRVSDAAFRRHVRRELARRFPLSASTLRSRH